MEFLVNLDGTDIFLCKSSCKEDEYRLEDKCLIQCPLDFNFIGYNKICKAESCALDPNGEHYFQINKYDTPSPSYSINKCVNSCTEAAIDSHNFNYYTDTNPNECLEQCPNNYYYLDSNPYECLSQCPESYPFYNDPASNPNKCSDTNHCESGTHFDNGDCVSSCTGGKKYISSDNRCLGHCPNNEIKKKSSTDRLKINIF